MHIAQPRNVNDIVYSSHLSLLPINQCGGYADVDTHPYTRNQDRQKKVARIFIAKKKRIITRSQTITEYQRLRILLNTLTTLWKSHNNNKHGWEEQTNKKNNNNADTHTHTPINRGGHIDRLEWERPSEKGIGGQWECSPVQMKSTMLQWRFPKCNEN